jgi:thymidylate synthase
MNVASIRNQFAHLYVNDEFTVDKSGCKMLELVGSSFIADAEAIFGEPNRDYISREIEWYESQSLAVDDIPGKTPEIWERISDAYGIINSNYGYLIYSERNGYQYANVLQTLKDNPDSRQATMVYNRPSIHADAYVRGRSDFICTNAVNYFLRNGYLHAVVQMRSNDVIFGYRNDWAWQKYVLDNLCTELRYEGIDVAAGDITWQAASLHIYERHFNYVSDFVHEHLL